MHTDSGIVRRTMTPAERRCATPVFPWADLAFAPLNGVLAAVPAVVVVGLPLYLLLTVAGVDAPGDWVSLLGIGAFGYAIVRSIYPGLSGFLRDRARVDDDLIDDVVEDSIVDVSDGVEIVADPPAVYLQLTAAATTLGDAIVLRGDYVARLRRTGCFPSTTLRLVQLPRSRAVVGVLPLGEAFQPALVSGRDHRPVELDGQPSQVAFESLRSRAR